ncbi:hypothetical protein [Thermocladium modestius]|nr:hypothetical protein [Thermocladium modestius]
MASINCCLSSCGSKCSDDEPYLAERCVQECFDSCVASQGK